MLIKIGVPINSPNGKFYRMCFSAEASFGTGVVTAIVGAVTVRKAETPSRRVFAMIPLFLSIQQCMEGILWLSLPQPEYLLWQRIGMYGFLLFAWVVWPTYIPFSVRLLEIDEKRKKYFPSSWEWAFVHRFSLPIS